MNSFLLWLGVAVALVLSAAFAAPFFIDWSSYRSYFEAKASEIVGRPVVFEGDLNVRIVPFPSLTADTVRIGDPGSGEGVERIDLRAALTPLLSGELQITDLTLVRPNAVLRVDTAGRISWAAAGEPSTPVDPERVAIDRFEIVAGRFAVEDDRSGSTAEFSEVNLSGSATSLRGPFKVEGGGLHDGERYTLQIATGRMSGDGTGMRIKASILPAARPLSIELDGALLRIEGTPAFDGRLIVERPAPDPEAATWKLDGKLTASPEKLVLDDLSVRLGTETQNVSLAGAANVRLGADPRFDAVVSARQVDMDRAFGAGPDSPVSPREAVARFGALLDPSMFPLPGHLTLDVESMVLSGGLMEGLSVDLDVEETVWSVERATVTAPGRASLGLAGTIGFSGPTPEFDGAARLSTSQATVFANWIFGPGARLPGFAIPAGSFEASGQIGIDAAGMQFDRAEVRSGGSRIEGSVAYRAPKDGGRGVVALVVTAEALDMSEHTPAPMRDELTVAGAIEALLSGVDLEMQVEVGTLALSDIEAHGVSVTGRVADGDIRFDELAVGDIGGTRLTGGGEIRSYARAPDGSLSLEVSAESLDGVVAALRALDLPAVADSLEDRADALVPADITVELAAASTDTGSRGTLTVAGSAGGSRLDGTFGYEGAIDDFGAAAIDVALGAENANGARLARQVGLIAYEKGGGAPGQVSLTAKGRARDSVNFTLNTAGLGLDGRIEGSARWPRAGGREIAARLALDIADTEAMLALAGFALPSEGGTALRVDGSLSATDDIWRFSDLAIKHGEETVTGSLTFDMGGSERALGGALEAGRIDLPWVLGALVSETAVRMPDATFGDTAWPAAEITPAQRPGWRGRIELATPAFGLFGGVTLNGAQTTFTFDETRLSFESLRGDLFGGRMTGGVDLTEADGVAALSGRAELVDGRLEEIVWKDSGRAVASGAVSASVEFNGRGRSLSAIVASLSGTGSFSVAEGVLRRLNPAAFDQIVSAADAGLDLTEDRVRRTFAGHLDSGSLTFESMEGAFSISSGVLRASNIRIDTRTLESFASATIDLPILGLDSEWTLRTDADDEAGRTREVGVVFAGPIAAPSRQIDVNPLLGYLTVRAFEQEVERLEALQTEILEKQRLGRELIRQGQERTGRERERRQQEEAAQAAADEAAREAAEEKERRAEQERLRKAEEDAQRRAEEERRRAEEQARQRQIQQQRQPQSQPQPQPQPQPQQQSPSAIQSAPLPPPQQQPQLQSAPVGATDNTELQRRIEDILRDIPSARDGEAPTGGIVVQEPPPPVVVEPAPPLQEAIGTQPREPLVISPPPSTSRAAPRAGAEPTRKKVFAPPPPEGSINLR